MALVVADRVQETTTTTGTGTYTLAGAKAGFQSFGAVGDGNTTYYACTDGTDYEVGIGTYTATGTTLARTTIIESSNSDLAVSWGAGSKDIFVTSPADKTLLVGRNLYADNPSSATMPSATGTNAFAIGSGAISAGSNSAALGVSRASNTNAVAIAIGSASTSYGATGLRSLAHGDLSKATATSALAIGGPYAVASASYAIAIGRAAATGSGAVAIGTYTSYGTPTASAVNAIAIGDGNTSSQSGAVTLGTDNTAGHIDAIVIGQGASSSAADQITLGHTDQTVRISSSYTLPTADGTNGQVLTTDGAGAVTFADAGGNLELYAENPSTPTAPSATGANAVAIGSGATASGLNSIALADSTASNTNAVALGNTALSSGFGSVALGFSSNAQASYAISIGRTSNATGSYTSAIGLNSGANGSIATTGAAAMALGGSYASGTDSFAAAIANNTSSYGATGANSIAIGAGLAKATSSRAMAFGNNAIASGADSVAIGRSTDSTASSAFAFGYNCLASGVNSFATGYQSKAEHIGKAAYASGSFSGGYDGDAQNGTFILRSDTTDATAEALTTNNSTAGSTNQVILPNNSAYSFSGTIIARESAAAGSDYASWEIKGALLRDANAASTVLGNGIVNKLYATSGASTWAIALSADTTNGGLKVEATGAASTNIRWVATVNTSEVTYA
jgi:hypothetical protein